MIVLKRVLGEKRVDFDIRLDAVANTASIVEITEDDKDGETFTFKTPFEMSRVGTALITAATRWEALLKDPR